MYVLESVCVICYHDFLVLSLRQNTKESIQQNKQKDISIIRSQLRALPQFRYFKKK